MTEKEGYIRFTYLEIQLKSSVEAKVNGFGDLFINSKYVRFQADNKLPGYHQCGIIPWDEISYISYDRI